MNKIVITIYVASLDIEYDIRIPIGIKVVDALVIIQDSIYDLSNCNFSKNETLNLFSSEGFLINKNNIVKFSGLKNGMKVILL